MDFARYKHLTLLKMVRDGCIQDLQFYLLPILFSGVYELEVKWGLYMIMIIPLFPLFINFLMFKLFRCNVLPLFVKLMTQVEWWTGKMFNVLRVLIRKCKQTLIGIEDCLKLLRWCRMNQWGTVLTSQQVLLLVLQVQMSRFRSVNMSLREYSHNFIYYSLMTWQWYFCNKVRLTYIF